MMLDEACEHGEKGICLECPILMEEAVEESAWSVILKAVGIPLMVLLIVVLVLR